ncbi:MAG: DUF1559 domain-containing protein, partial [Rhodopirellula sp.]|nr:DUF1559 domain-containing protein [Rhodopirellula sp.]
ADTLVVTGEYEEALEEYTLTAQEFSRLKKVVDEARAEFALARVLRTLQRHRESIPHFTRAFEAYEQAGEEVDASWLLDWLGLAYQSVGDDDEAEIMHQLALSRFRQSKHLKGQATTANRLGDVLTRQQQPAKAILSYRVSAAAYQELRQPLEAALAWQRVGTGCQSMRDKAKALEAFTQAVTQYLLVEDRAARAAGLSATAFEAGRLQFDQQEYAIAVGSFELAADEYEFSGEASDSAMMRSRIADCHYAAGEIALAIESQLECCRRLRLSVSVEPVEPSSDAENVLRKSQQELATGLKRLADFQVMASRWSDARVALSEAAGLRQELNQPADQAAVLILQSGCEERLGLESESAATFQRVLDSLAKVESKDQHVQFLAQSANELLINKAVVAAGRAFTAASMRSVESGDTSRAEKLTNEYAEALAKHGFVDTVLVLLQDLEDSDRAGERFESAAGRALRAASIAESAERLDEWATALLRARRMLESRLKQAASFTDDDRRRIGLITVQIHLGESDLAWHNERVDEAERLEQLAVQQLLKLDPPLSDAAVAAVSALPTLDRWELRRIAGEQFEQATGLSLPDSELTGTAPGVPETSPEWRERLALSVLLEGTGPGADVLDAAASALRLAVLTTLQDSPDAFDQCAGLAEIEFARQRFDVAAETARSAILLANRFRSRTGRDPLSIQDAPVTGMLIPETREAAFKHFSQARLDLQNAGRPIDVASRAIETIELCLFEVRVRRQILQDSRQQGRPDSSSARMEEDQELSYVLNTATEQLANVDDLPLAVTQLRKIIELRHSSLGFALPEENESRLFEILDQLISAPGTEDAAELALIWHFAAQSYQLNEQRQKESVTAHERALEFAVKAKDQELIASSAGIIGDDRYFSGQPGQAAELWLQSAAADVALGDSPAAFAAFLDAARALTKVKAYDRAVAAYESALKLAPQIAVPDVADDPAAVEADVAASESTTKTSSDANAPQPAQKLVWLPRTVLQRLEFDAGDQFTFDEGRLHVEELEAMVWVSRVPGTVRSAAGMSSSRPSGGSPSGVCAVRGRLKDRDTARLALLEVVTAGLEELIFVEYSYVSGKKQAIARTGEFRNSGEFVVTRNLDFLLWLAATPDVREELLDVLVDSTTDQLRDGQRKPDGSIEGQPGGVPLLRATFDPKQWLIKDELPTGWQGLSTRSLLRRGFRVPSDPPSFVRGVQPLLSSFDELELILSPAADQLNLTINVKCVDEVAAKQLLDTLPSLQELLLSDAASWGQPSADESSAAIAVAEQRVAELIRHAIGDARFERNGAAVLMRIDTVDVAQLQSVPAYVAAGLQKVRRDIRWLMLRNNLKQIGLAFHNFSSSNEQRLPAAFNRAPDGTSLLSWRVHLLPFLGDEAAMLYRQFRLDEPWDSPHNRRLINQMPGVYRHPDNNRADGRTNLLLLTGPESAWSGEKPLKFSEIDVSGTILVVTVDDDRAVPWTQPTDFNVDPGKPVNGLGTHFDRGVPILLADGTVLSLTPNPESDRFRAFVTPQKEIWTGSDNDPRMLFYEVSRDRRNEVNATPADDLESIAFAIDEYRSQQEQKHEILSEAPDLFLPPQYSMNAEGEPLLSWRVHLLPTLGRADLYQQFRIDEAWDSPHNRRLLTQMPEVFRHRDSPAESTSTRFLLLTGPGTAYENITGPSHKLLSEGGNSDRTAIAIVVPEKQAVPWTKPDDFHYSGPLSLYNLIEASDGGALSVITDNLSWGEVLPLTSGTDTSLTLEQIGQIVSPQFEPDSISQRLYRLSDLIRHQVAFKEQTLGIGAKPLDGADDDGESTAVRSVRRLTRVQQETQRIKSGISAGHLSWRVQLLPFLGYGELFEKFRLEDAWDSPHNRALISEIPAIYRLPHQTSPPEEGRTPFVMFTGQGSAAAQLSLGISPHDLDDDALLLGIAGPEHEVVWTQPVDLPVDLDQIEKSLLSGQLRELRRDQYTHPWLLNGDDSVRVSANGFAIGCWSWPKNTLLPSSLNPKLWRALATGSQHERISYQDLRGTGTFGNPPDVVPSRPEKRTVTKSP